MVIEDIQVVSSSRRSERRAVDASVFSADEWQAIAQRLDLSYREVEIAQGIFDDLKENGIAERLNLSPHTVHEYLKRLYRKLVVSGRVQLVLLLVKERLARSTSTAEDKARQLEEAC